MKVSFRILAICLVVAFALGHEASANLIQDANFSGISYSGTVPLTTQYGLFGTETGSTLSLANWTTTGYNFVYAPGTADAGTDSAGANSGQPKEAPGEYNTSAGYGNTYIWGPANGSSNGLPSTDPAGGNFIAMDGTFEVGAVKQTITGLTPGQMYYLKFYWAGAQQENFTGATTEDLHVSLGGSTLSTGTVSNVSKGFTGWMADTMYFTATNSSETLSFLASGTPNGEPPFTLLGGIDLEVIPDFSNWMIFAGFGAVCIVFETVRRRRRRGEFAPAG